MLQNFTLVHCTTLHSLLSSLLVLSAVWLLLQSVRCSHISVADHFSRQRFFEAFAAVLGAALYLPSAGCFALIPLLSSLPRTGQESGAQLDYHAASGGVQLRAQRRLG